MCVEVHLCDVDVLVPISPFRTSIQLLVSISEFVQPQSLLSTRR